MMHLAAWWRSVWRPFIGEIVGTFVLILLSDGVVANVSLAPRLNPGAYNWNTITVGCAIAVTLAIYISAGVSGAHINPAVTLALAIRRKFPWKMVPAYWLGQFIGCFLGACGVYGVYFSGLRDAGMPNVWCTGPGSSFDLAFWGGKLQKQVSSNSNYLFVDCFVAEVIGTMILLWGVAASGDLKNTGLPPNAAPVVVGVTILAIGDSLGGPSGYALNPARDFSPRLFGSMIGTLNLFSTGYWWIPIVAPTIGAVVGICSYDFLVGCNLRVNHLPPPPAPTTTHHDEGYFRGETLDNGHHHDHRKVLGNASSNDGGFHDTAILQNGHVMTSSERMVRQAADSLSHLESVVGVASTTASGVVGSSSAVVLRDQQRGLLQDDRERRSTA